MTAEIAILNKRGIVLASDSASTIGGNKVYNTAKKIFTLDSKHSIGIMIYGNAEFMDTPWDVIIGKYRKEQAGNTLASIDDYSNSFFEFLKKQDYLKKTEIEDNYVYRYMNRVIEVIFENSQLGINEILSKGGQVSNSMLIELLKIEIDKINIDFSNNSDIISIDKTEFQTRYTEMFNHVLRNISNVDEASDALYTDLFNLIYTTIKKSNFFIPSSGIVIAGYGTEELFPSLRSFHLSAFVMGNLNYSNSQNVKIEYSNGQYPSTIVPFAQVDVIHTVVQGIDPQLSQFLANQTSRFKGGDLNSYQDVINELARLQSTIIDPMLDMISLLPVEETSVIAETLLNLTSFKRKYSNSIETVGGPIDVLAITPNEGPIWIKRKQYFKLDDNLGYKIRRDSNG